MVGAMIRLCSMEQIQHCEQKMRWQRSPLTAKEGKNKGFYRTAKKGRTPLILGTALAKTPDSAKPTPPKVSADPYAMVRGGRVYVYTGDSDGYAP